MPTHDDLETTTGRHIADEQVLGEFGLKASKMAPSQMEAVKRMATELTTLRARLAAVEGEREKHPVTVCTESYDRGFNAGLTATVQLRNLAERKAGAELALRLAWEVWHSPSGHKHCLTEREFTANGLATLFPEAPDVG